MRTSEGEGQAKRMCGIVSYVGKQQAAPIVVEGLKRLEYRGYDSAGVAIVQDGRFELRRAVGKLQNGPRTLHMPEAARQMEQNASSG